MNRETVFLHRAREQIIKTITHLHNARHHIDKTFKRLRIAHDQPNCNVAKTNCEAIRQGIDETIKMLAQTAAKLRVSLRQSNGQKLPPERGAHLSTRLTPKQRDLENSGHLNVRTIPTHTKPKQQNRNVNIQTYKPKVKPKKPKRNKLDIPI